MIRDNGILDDFMRSLCDETLYEVRQNALLSDMSTFGIGGKALYAVRPKTSDALCRLISALREKGFRFIVIGNGSNLLFDDNGYNGVVIQTSYLSGIEFDGENVTVDCGVSLTHLSSVAMKRGLSGLAFAYGIPGTVGGAIFMNAGAYGGEMKDVVKAVTWYDTESGELGESFGDENAFGYRESIYQDGKKVILSVTLSLKSGNPNEIKAEMDDYMTRRLDKQPLEYGSAGSTFKRYPGYFTGKLIEDAGLKGYTIGGAQVSEKHAGFVVNVGGATSNDVLALIQYIKDKIFEINGIHIECEVQYIPCED